MNLVDPTAGNLDPHVIWNCGMTCPPTNCEMMVCLVSRGGGGGGGGGGRPARRPDEGRERYRGRR